VVARQRFLIEDIDGRARDFAASEGLNKIGLDHDRPTRRIQSRSSRVDRDSIGWTARAVRYTDSGHQADCTTRTALAEPAYQRSLIEGGFEPVLYSNPEKFRQSLAADVALWAPAVKSLGLKLD
jgi:hypothetical protein